jgi:Domain of unknown function (DUF4249)
MKKITLFIISFFLTFACREKEIEYDLPFEGEKLVVIGILNPDEPFIIKVSHTWSSTGIVPKNTFVSDAIVNILEDGKLKERLAFDKEGSYVSNKNTKPLLGHKYSVEVSSPKYSKVSSEQVQVPNNKASFTYEQIPDISYKYNKDDPRDQINVVLQDDPSKPTFYAINFELSRSKSDNDSLRYGGGIVFYLDDDGEFTTNKECSFRQSIDNDKKSATLQIFSNQCFTNTKPIFHFAVDKAYATGYVNYKKVYKKIENPTLNVYQFDKGYFEYLKLKDQPDGLFERAFTEPHTTYTNIKGGYGIIGAITKKSELLNMTCKICQ